MEERRGSWGTWGSHWSASGNACGEVDGESSGEHEAGVGGAVRAVCGEARWGRGTVAMRPRAR